MNLKDSENQIMIFFRKCRKINGLIELTSNEFPTLDNYFIWLMAVDYTMEKLGIKEDYSNMKIIKKIKIN